jgi:type IV pilus assembly protein PilA
VEAVFVDGTGRQHGFTLVELLSVVLVLGVLAGLAIPAMLRQIDVARVAVVEADLRNAAAAQASLSITTGSPANALVDLFDQGFRPSADVTFTNDGQFTTHPSGMCMQAEHSRLPGRSWAFAADGGANPSEGVC